MSHLIPEGDDVRKRWSVYFGETKADAFTLLRHTGADASGAVQVVPRGVRPSDIGVVRELSEQQAGQRLR